ncbi:MAG: alpha/beta hydrolase [Chloroflexota bacterium]
MPFANNSGVKIYYEVEGQGRPLILQHGLGRSLESWRILGYAQELKKDYQLILVDARGHGKSDRPHDPQAYTYEKFASDYVAILDDLEIVKASYFGYSMGAAIGFKAIAKYALSRFNSLILGGINPMNTTPEPERLLFKEQISSWTLAIKEGLQAHIASWERRYGRPFDPRLVPTMLANDPEALLLITRRLADEVGVEEVLPKINVPCLLFAGTVDVFHPGIKEAATRMPNATFFSLLGHDHMQAYTHIELTLPYIKKFLAEVNR